ncbi:MAG: rhomboid family intramembrane serine protease [Flavobacteriaceae bacterium]|nr:rhomboid family intramembrane serine protease [Flavobacteriaceae bacterium]
MNKAVLLIIIANVLVSFKGFQDRPFFEKFKFQIGPIVNGEKIRMLTSGFLHVDQSHLFFNMLTLYFFADPVIDHVGMAKFLAIYFGSLLAGSLFALTFHKKEPYYSAVGASGAVMGVVYAAIMLNPGMNLYLFFIPIPIPAYIFGVGYLLYSMFGMKKQWGNIGHSAHIGGAIGGFLLTILLFPQVLSQNKLMIIILAVPIVLMFVFKDKLESK